MLQLCPTLCNPMDCSPPGSSVQGILQARILAWVAMPSSRGSSWPRDRILVSYVSCIGRGGSFTTNATWETLNFFSFIFISWRLITLQYYSGFCHTLTWISQFISLFPIPIPPPTSLPIPSLWVIPVHQPRALVSCIQPGLAICFTLDNIHVLMLFSQIIPPSPSPIESKSLFCTSVSLFLSCI